MTTNRYLVALVDGGGTVPVELGVVRRLVVRGHDVVVLAEDSMAADVVATGAAFRRWTTAPNRPDRRPENDPYRDWECKNPRQLFARLLESQFAGPLSAYAADTEEAIIEHRPDLIVCSQFAFGAMVAAEIANVPFDVLIPNIYLFPFEGSTPFGLGLRPHRHAIGRIRDRALRSVLQHLWDKGLAKLNSVRTERGLTPLDHFLDQPQQARRQLVLTSTAFDFPAPPTLPANVRYVGPVLDDPTWASADTAAWMPARGDEPLVLVGLSSTFQDHVATLQRIVDALATLPVRGVVTTGPAVESGSVTPASNVVVVPSAPHRAVLTHAAVAITHGGHGTVVKALAAGVPLVVLPHGRDQADNAVRVTSRRAGVKLKRTASVDAIAAAVREVLADSAYAAAATRLGEAIREDAAASTAISELESVVRSGLPRARGVADDDVVDLDAVALGEDPHQGFGDVDGPQHAIEDCGRLGITGHLPPAGGDARRVEDVQPHAGAGEFVAQGCGESLEAPLGRAVGGAVRLGARAGDRGHVDEGDGDRLARSHHWLP